MTDPQVQLSIVATVYCTGGYLAEFCSRSFAAALEAGDGTTPPRAAPVFVLLDLSPFASADCR